MEIDFNLENFLQIKIRKVERVYHMDEIVFEANEILKSIKSVKGGSPREMIFSDLKNFFAFRKGFKPINLNKKNYEQRSKNVAGKRSSILCDNDRQKSEYDCRV